VDAGVKAIGFGVKTMSAGLDAVDFKTEAGDAGLYLFGCGIDAIKSVKSSCCNRDMLLSINC
jgi:hypothetical protein